jgi:DNA-binding winged helix-turn-helix (wHTH) protein
MDSVSEAPASVEFGRFRILPQRREVFADGRLMELGGRAFDVLVVLIEAQGAVVSKDELKSSSSGLRSSTVPASPDFSQRG